MTTTATRPLTTHGIVGGFIAGLIFIVFEMFASAIIVGLAAFFMPLRMIAAMVMGQGVLDPTAGLFGPLVVGAIVHFTLAAAFGVLFAMAAPSIVRSANGAAGVVVAASVYGFLLWIVNFYVIAPVAGWYWFPERADAVVQFLAHTFAFGSVLGLYLNSQAGIRLGHPTTTGVERP